MVLGSIFDSKCVKNNNSFSMLNYTLMSSKIMPSNVRKFINLRIHSIIYASHDGLVPYSFDSWIVFKGEKYSTVYEMQKNII